MNTENGNAETSRSAATGNAGHRIQQLRTSIEDLKQPAPRGFSATHDPRRTDRTPLETPTEGVIQQAAPTEDTFIAPAGPINHDGPPKDPSAPSGSLSSDESEAIAVDFAAANPPRPNI
jgi:hypothetical protein